MITALGGGVGAAKFLEGLSSLIADETLNVVVNTADDIFLNGLKISPDVDTIIYRLCGKVDVNKGWGLQGDTFNCLDALKRFGLESWFGLGDRDIATHLFRTYLHGLGYSATEITSKIAQAYRLKKNITVLPMTDQHVETWIKTDKGEIHFQEYLVKYRMSSKVEDVIIKDIGEAKPAPGIIDSIQESRVIVICPSNPIISIGPILQIEGIRDALSHAQGKKIAISPLIGGKPLKGPADKLMKALGLDVSSTQVAALYKDFLDIMVIDTEDAAEADNISDMGIRPVVLDTLMSDRSKAVDLASQVLEAAG